MRVVCLHMWGYSFGWASFVCEAETTMPACDEVWVIGWRGPWQVMRVVCHTAIFRSRSLTPERLCCVSFGLWVATRLIALTQDSFC